MGSVLDLALQRGEGVRMAVSLGVRRIRSADSQNLCGLLQGAALRCGYVKRCFESFFRQIATCLPRCNFHPPFILASERQRFIITE